MAYHAHGVFFFTFAIFRPFAISWLVPVRSLTFNKLSLHTCALIESRNGTKKDLRSPRDVVTRPDIDEPTAIHTTESSPEASAYVTGASVDVAGGLGTGGLGPGGLGPGGETTDPF